MKTSDLLLRALEEEGVEYIFGVPGEENADVMISLLDSKINFIITRHEQGAAFMADLYGRLTGKPGVCLATLGPGATNLATGVASANFDRSPLVALTGQASTKRLHKESHQNVDIVSMFGPLTKWATTVRQPSNVPEVVHKAFRLAAHEKPGAVLVELPEDIAKQDCALAPIPAEGYKLRRPAPDHKAIARVVELLEGARRPIVLAGNGCIRERASKQLERLVRETGLMVAHTFMAKGAIDDRDEHSLLTAGLGSRDHVSEAFEKADLVLAVGYDLIEWPPDRWNQGMDKQIVHIDFEAAEVDNHYRCEVEVVSDIAAALWEINEQFGGRRTFDVPLFRHLRDHMVSEVGFPDLASASHEDLDEEAVHAASSNAFPLKPQRILRDLRERMNEGDILISDVGAHKMWVARHYLTYLPGSCIISNGFCSMGIALPGAIAAKLVEPGRAAVGLMGDGGFAMNVQELATAVQYEIPCVSIVWEDGGYGLIEWKQEVGFGVHSHTRFTNPDLVELAASFGARAFRVGAASELGSALDEALSEKKLPSVIVVPVDYSENKKLTERLGKLIAH